MNHDQWNVTSIAMAPGKETISWQPAMQDIEAEIWKQICKRYVSKQKYTFISMKW